ncbi:peptide chain release factor N(5)-glutamine methyltransferase [Propionivibrio limicola]|uniref:peptide chain release factor N(5)-glutamine methyltransferase n=1 Tax=Propionivibrio limicola TaxID=167645 RepID=UPI001290A562|nr:peptide chain release factor N(5)-glutamine methyltransferase [Propionivibrio limicola]
MSEAGNGVRLGDVWREACQRIDRLDARLLIEHVCGCTRTDLIAHPERLLTPEQAQRLAELLARREAGEPLAYLTGSAWFYDREFAVTPDVLIPRPDTEVLVDQALERTQKLSVPRIVDLGTGSGIVAIMLAKLCPQASVTAVDISPASLAVARANAARHGVDVRFLEGDWYAPLGDERFDLIVSNPPYVVDGDPHLQLNGLPFEPQHALTDGVAGGDGLACIRILIDGAPAHLRPGGWLLIEHGYDQAVKVRELLRARGFAGVDSWRDGADIERVSGGHL